MTDKKTRAGFAAIIGAPNAGKSTLLNTLIGQKLSIVSHKAQTTRLRVLGLLTEKETQIGFIDTPGILSGRTGSAQRLEKAMQTTILQSLEDADVILLIVDASATAAEEKAKQALAFLKETKAPLFLALNKTDQMAKEKLLPLIERMDMLKRFEEIFPISALTGDGVEPMKAKIIEKIPKGKWFFPEDQLSDMPSNLLAAEITREQLFMQLHDELPYGATVLPESWERLKNGSIKIKQTIVVSKQAHRPMVLGKGGMRIKSIGQRARAQMKEALGVETHLFLDVKVDEKWSMRNEFYTLFGLEGNAGRS